MDSVIFIDTMVIEFDTVVATAISRESALVEWSTTFEINVLGFIIENSEDGLIYDSIGMVEATAADSMGADYSYTDSLNAKDCLEYYKVIAFSDREEYVTLGIDTVGFVYSDEVVTDSFEADYLNEDVLLTWGTWMERCNDHFEIEYSADNITYFPLSQIPAINNTNTWTPYQYLDNSTEKVDTIWYKLYQQFSDESMQLVGMDSIIFIEVGLNDHTFGEIEIQFNNGYLNIYIEESFSGDIKVINAAGATMSHSKIDLYQGDNQHYLSDWIHWANGVYFVFLENETGKFAVKVSKTGFE